GLSNVGNQFLSPGPAAPANLVGVGKTGTSIEVRWSNAAASGSSTLIQRSTDGINYTLIATVSPGTTTYLDTGLALQTQYSCRAQAVNVAGSSQWTYTVSNTGVPSAPSNLVGAVTGATQVTLTWNDNSNNEGGFTIQRSGDGVNWTALPSAQLNSTSY